TKTRWPEIGAECLQVALRHEKGRNERLVLEFVGDFGQHGREVRFDVLGGEVSNHRNVIMMSTVCFCVSDFVSISNFDRSPAIDSGGLANASFRTERF